MSDKSEFSGALKAWRETQGLSQRALAKRLGITQSTIFRYEKGVALPSAAIRQKLLREMKCQPELIPENKPYTRTKNAKLTEAERKFAEKNHGIVLAYLGSRHLNDDDWYDVVVFGYLHAVQVWYRRKELHKFAFSSIAYAAMYDAVKTERARLRRRPITVSIYDAIPNTNNFTYLDRLCDPRDCVRI